MTAELQVPDLDRVVSRLLERLLELEAQQKTPGDMSEALRGVRANQLDARGNRGGIWYIVESKWSIVAIAIACLALGVAISTGSVVVSRLIETTRELATEKRLRTAAMDDLRMENRAVLRAAGVPLEPAENHDISEIAEKAVRGKP